jgi:hypothetical protein
MRVSVFVAPLVGIVFGTQAEFLPGDPAKEADTEKIARLVKELGNETFAKRETASEELIAIGVPALTASRRVAASSEDPEVRRRAERVIQSIVESEGSKAEKAFAYLIKELGDEAFARREMASEELKAIGEPALVALEKAAELSDDLEIRQRADRAMRSITGSNGGPERSRAAMAIAFLSSVRSAQERYQARQGTYADDLTKLDVDCSTPKYFDVGRMTADETTWSLTLTRKASCFLYGQYTVTYTQEGLDADHSTIADADHLPINPMAN